MHIQAKKHFECKITLKHSGQEMFRKNTALVFSQTCICFLNQLVSNMQMSG